MGKFENNVRIDRETITSRNATKYVFGWLQTSTEKGLSQNEVRRPHAVAHFTHRSEY